MATNLKLFNGDSKATAGYYFITNSNNATINNKTISVDDNGYITILNADGLWDSDNKKVYIKDSSTPITIGTDVGNIILTTAGVKYSTDGSTWN